MNTKFAFLLALFFSVGAATAAPVYENVTLAWDASPDTDIVGYNVYQRAASATWAAVPVGRTDNLTVYLPVNDGDVFYVTAVNSAMAESSRSNEVTYVSPIGGQQTVAVSRKVHGTTFFDVQLPLTGAPGVECRTGGTSGEHSVVVTFLDPVSSVGNVSITTGAGTVSGFTISGTQVFVSLEGVDDAQRIGIEFTDVTLGVRTLSFTLPMSLLVGDTTGSGTVNASDIGEVKAMSGQTLDASNFRADVTANGSINASDVGLVKASAGTMLPP